MSLQQIINDLKTLGENEVAAKLHFMRLGFNQPERFNVDAWEIADLFLWKGTPEGVYYWSCLNEKLREFRKKRSTL